MMKTELPVSVNCGSADGQSTISCADCKSSWRLEKELSIQSLTSCFPGPALLGDLKDDDKIKLSIFVLAGTDRNPPCIAALHLENLNSPWKIGHLQTWDTEYVADRDALFNAQAAVCKILNQQELPKVKKEPCQDEKRILELPQIESTKLVTEDKQTQTSGTTMKENSQHMSTSSLDKLEHNLNIVTESNSEKQSNILCETKNTDQNDSSKENGRSRIDEDFSVDIKDEPVGDIKKEKLGFLNDKLTSSSHKNKRNPPSNVCLKENKSKPMQPSTSLKNVPKEDDSINTKQVSLPERKDKSKGSLSNQTNVTQLTMNNVNEHNLIINKDKDMNIKEEPRDEIENQSKSSDVDNSHLISYDIKEEMLEDYLEGQQDHLNQTTFRINKNKTISCNSEKTLEYNNDALQKKENYEVPIDIKDVPIINPDCEFKFNKKYNKVDDGIKASSSEKCLKNIESSHVSSEKESDDNSILMIDTKELQDILKCVHDNIGNRSETQPKIVQNINTNAIKVKNVDNLKEKTVSFEEKSIHNKKEKLKNSLLSKNKELNEAIVSKVSSRNDCNDKNLPNTVSTKNMEISGVVANITEKILGDINAKIISTNLNSTVKKQDAGNSLGKNFKELETLPLKSTCDKSKLVKKELFDKSDHNMTSNEDLTKLVLTRKKNHNDWNLLVTLDNARNKSTNEFDKNSSLGNNCKELETVPVKPTCNKSKMIKKELFNKSDQNLTSNEDLTKLVLTRNKNHNDWNLLVTLDTARNKSTEEFDKNSKLMEKSKESVSNISDDKSETTINFDKSLEIQNLNSKKCSGKQASLSVENNTNHLIKSSKHENFQGNECSKINNDGNKLDERELVKMAKQYMMDKHDSDTIESKVENVCLNSVKINKVEYKAESIPNNVRNDDGKVISTKNLDAIEKDIQRHKKVKNNSQNEKRRTKEKQIKNSKQKQKSAAPAKLTKLRHRHNSSSSSSSNSSSSESESCSSSSECSNSSSSESGSSASSRSSHSSSRSSSTSSSRSNPRSSRRSRHAQSKLKNLKKKDHLQNEIKCRKDEDAIIISDESEDDIKIKLEKMSKGYESASKNNEALSLNSINVLVDEKNNGFVCEAQNAPNDINIITRPEYIIIAKKSLGNLKVTECENGNLLVDHEKVVDPIVLSKKLVKCDKKGDKSHKEENIVSLSNKRLQNKRKEDSSSIVRNLEEVNKDCSIQDYCNMNTITSLHDVLSARKLSEVKAKMKKRQNKLKMHRKSKETVGKVKSPNDLSLEDISDTEEVEDSTENPFCKLSVSSISNDRLSDDSHLLLGDSSSDISVDISGKKKAKRRSHSKTLDNASHRKYRRKGEDLQQAETLRKERLNTWISHVNDHLSPDHMMQSKSRKRKKELAEKSRHPSKHKKERSKHKSSHNERHSKKRKKRKHD